MFDPEDIEKANREYALIQVRYSEITVSLLKLQVRLSNLVAIEYMTQGVIRRLGTMVRAIDNVFRIFPLTRTELLILNELQDLDINLHAFIINIFGLLDNLAWVFVHEKQLTAQIDKKHVGLHKKKLQEHFTEEFKAYINSSGMKAWHHEYLTNYRDALAHRIPLYVPPKTLYPAQIAEEAELETRIADCSALREWDAVDALRAKQRRIGEICPYFIHSLSENRYVVLHAQLICDFMTVEELVKKYCQMF